VRERTLWVESGGGGRLLGVLSEPPDHRSNLPTVVLLNAGWVHRIGPNRMNVGLARRLAAMGHPCVRFDFSWVGDSEPRDDGLPMRRAAVEEARAVLDTLSEEIGSTSFVVGGLCSGADAAFRVALADDRVVGCVFIDGFPYRNLGWYWHHYARRLLRSPARNVGSVRRAVARMGARFEGGGRRPAPDLDRDIPSRSGATRGLRRLVHRGVRMCVIFSEGQLDWYNHAGQFEATFRSAGLQGLARVEYLRGTDHTFTLRSSRRRLEDEVAEWARGFASTG